MENYLSKSDNLLKICEKVKKGIKNIENQQKNMIKNLSYITKINKTQNEMKYLFQQLMRNIKINFNKENDEKLKFEDYYFNGICKPKDVEIKDITDCSINLCWKTDDLNILNLDKKQIKYIVEIKKKKKNKNFTKIYEGNESSCKIENLKYKTEYELRICTIYNELIGDWTEIQSFKTSEINCDSIILLESKKRKEYLKKLYEWTGSTKFELLYRATRDGNTIDDLHKKCDNKGPVIALCKHENEYIFGGYSSVDWKNRMSYLTAPNSFLFTLSNMYNIEPTKFPLKNNNDGNAIYDGDYILFFGAGHDLYIPNNCLNRVSYSKFPYTYQDTLGKGKSIFSGNMNNNDNNKYSEFKIKEVEIFKVIK